MANAINPILILKIEIFNRILFINWIPFYFEKLHLSENMADMKYDGQPFHISIDFVF